MRKAFALLLLSLVSGSVMLSGCRAFRNRERPPFRKVTPPVAFEVLRDNPDILIMDLRTRNEFLGDTGHIYRARNIPLERLPGRILEIAPFRDDTFLVYCRENDSCGEEGMAILISSGFENAILIEGGIDGWIRYGFRTVLPATPEETDGKAGSLLPPQ
ncbi:MAG TPA: rhodanese-like domain-containing protein [Thermoanaerobaculia bacterium]|nr:rhodanese-like domain-containing protein [Thermoanaerobaculia bacterium]